MVRFTHLISLAVPLLIIACATDESKLRSRADAGEAEAQYQLASMYWEGKEIDQDRNEGLIVVSARRAAWALRRTV